MTKEEREQLAARVISKNKSFVGLQANPDFQEWLEVVVKGEMSHLETKILSIDTSEEGWEKQAARYILEHQAINRAYIKNTNIRLAATQAARKVLDSENTKG